MALSSRVGWSAISFHASSSLTFGGTLQLGASSPLTNESCRMLCMIQARSVSAGMRRVQKAHRGERRQHL